MDSATLATGAVDAIHTNLSPGKREKLNAPSSKNEASLRSLLARPRLQDFLRRYYDCAGYDMPRCSLVHETWKRSVRRAVRYLGFVAGTKGHEHVRLGFQCRFQVILSSPPPPSPTLSPSPFSLISTIVSCVCSDGPWFQSKLLGL